MEDTKKPIIKCRVCLEAKPREKLAPVTKLWDSEIARTIKDVILFCVPTVNIQDNSYICESCLWQLKFACKFIERCLKTERILVKGTTHIIGKLPLAGNKGGKLEDIFGKSLGDGSQIQIIFENPTFVPDHVSRRNDDHTYYNRKKLQKSTQQENLVIKVEPGVKVETSEKAIVNLDDDDDDNADDDWFTDAVDVNTDRASDPEPDIPTDDGKYPEQLLDLLDFAPINVRCISMQNGLTPEHEKGLLQEGVNIVNMSTESSKKKRIIYLARDFEPQISKCLRCKLSFNTRCEFLDHKHFHRKGKIFKPGMKLLSCDQCSKKFQSDLQFKKHCALVHGLRRPHRCEKCLRRFRHCRELEAHQELFKDSGKCAIKCKKCDREFSYQSQLDHHEADVADAPCCNYRKCKTCSIKFTKEGFKEHCAVHPNHVCSECGKSFHAASNLYTHKKYVHNAASNMCHECGKVVKNAKVLEHHIETIHGNNNYVCEICGREYKSKFYLRKHFLLLHSGPRKQLVCEQCGKTFYTRYSLSQHMKNLHKVTPKFVCPTCGEGFVRKDYLKRHIARHDRFKRFTCEVCKKSFHSEAKLQTHRYFGHDENGQPVEQTNKYVRLPGKKFNSELPRVCNICHKVLSGAHALRLHYKTHLQIREFWCKICDITLQSIQTYRNHMKRHDNPNFALCCNICHIYQTSPEELEKHLQERHKDMKYHCKYCPAKFGRKHLLYSHEVMKHQEEYARKKSVFKMLASQKDTFASRGSYDGTRRGKKLSNFDVDLDDVINTLTQSTDESLLPSKGQDEAEFDVFSEEYRLPEQEAACKVLVENMQV